MNETVERYEHERLSDKECIVALALSLDQLKLKDVHYWSNNYRLDVENVGGPNNTKLFRVADTGKHRYFGMVIIHDNVDGERVAYIELGDYADGWDAQKRTHNLKSALRRMITAIPCRDYATSIKPTTEKSHIIRPPKNLDEFAYTIVSSKKTTQVSA